MPNIRWKANRPAGRPKARPRLLVLALVGVALLAAACGSNSTAATASGSSSDVTPPVTADDRGGAFPVTVEHRFGSTDLDAEPERGLSLGFQEHDTIFALGVETEPSPTSSGDG